LLVLKRGITSYNGFKFTYCTLFVREKKKNTEFCYFFTHAHTYLK